METSGMGHDGGHQEGQGSLDDAWSAALQPAAASTVLKARRKVPHRHEMRRIPGHSKARTLFFVDGSLGKRLYPSIATLPDLDLQLIVEDQDVAPEVGQDIKWHHNGGMCPRDTKQNHETLTKAMGLSRWANVFILPLSATRLAKMLAGLHDDLVLAVVRGWDVSKPILAIPEMSIDMWKNPLTRRQLTELGRNWPHVHVQAAVLWDVRQEEPGTASVVARWETSPKLLESIEDTIFPIVHGISVEDDDPELPESDSNPLPPPPKTSLPPELWTMILEALGDWEMAAALRIFTNLPAPPEWLPYLPSPSNAGAPRTLEYLILTAPVPVIRAALSRPITPARSLSHLAVRLIFKFARTDLLTYLSIHQKDIFWSSFGLTLLPHKASILYNQPSILQWWHTSPAVLKKEYGPEALDGASRAGFVDVLDWWLQSGLPLWYTERALESASAKGHLNVLKWWKAAAEATAADPARDAARPPRVTLKVGKSILAAAQSGHGDVLRWFCTASPPIAFGHEEGVARLASTHGHVAVLERWRDLKGSKMIFDHQVLVGATKNGHVAVLDWWKRSGYRVEYKTCDIEEAMEDAVGGGDAEALVRAWWERNGLNLGVGTSEWMKVKVL